MPDLPASLTSSADNLFQTLLEVSLTAVKLMRPVAGPNNELADFAIEYLNPAGQTMTQLPERPEGTLLSLFPVALATELLPFYRRVFETSRADRYSTSYQQAGVIKRVQLAAQRSGELLVVNLTDEVADRSLSAVEEALRESQAREREARAMAEVQHQQLDTLIMQAPACIARLAGPSHTFTVANPLYHQLFGGRQLVGKDIREALPELASEPFFGLLDTVYRTGETFYGNEIPIYLDEVIPGQSEPRYFNFINQATQDATGKVDGILVYAYDVTEQVHARQMLERNKTQLQALNDELKEANEKLGAATRQAEEARAEADLQRQQLYNILMQAPAMICMFEGPEHRFSLINPSYQQLVGERPLLGQPIRQAMPELAGQPIFELLDRVYRTGETFYAQEMLVQLDHANMGSDLGENYYNFVYQATRNLAGAVEGILVFAYEVTAQVKARRQVELSRQQVQNLNEELAATNAELQAANEEFLASNAELVRTQQQLKQLNIELENRVQERTQALQRAQTEADRQRQRLDRLFMQAPAAICMLSGPDLVFELVNPGYQELFADRQLLNKPILEAMPEIEGNVVYKTLRLVYEIGGTHHEQNLLIPFARPEDGVLEDRYFNFIQQARYDEYGHIDGVLVFVFEVTEQVQAQQRADVLQAEVLASAQRLAQERETFYQVFEQTPACICVLHGPEHRIEYYNEAYQQLFPGRQMWGRTIAETQPDAVAQGFLALLDNVYQTGETFYGNELLLTIDQLDGKVPKDTYFNFTYQAYKENGSVIGVSVFAYDVTEQVRVRQQRDAQRQQLEQLFMQAPAAICILRGADLVYELVNPGYQQLFPDRTLLGKPILEALPEIAEHVVYQTFREVYQTGVSHEEKALLIPLMRPNDGLLEDRFFNFVQQARYDEQGCVDGVLVFAFEVTEQVQARQQAERSEARFRRLAETTPMIVWEADAAGHTTYLSPRWEQFTATANGQGLGWKEYIHSDDQEPFVQAWLTAVSTQQTFQAEARLRLAATGEYRWYLDRAVPVRDAAGVVVQWVGAATDIHEQKLAAKVLQRLTHKLRKARDEGYALNRELEATNQQLTRTNIDLDNFIYTASHDLKAPITNIEGLLHALEAQLPVLDQSGDIPFILAMMQGAVDRFKSTIDHLTDVSKLQKEHDQPAVSVHLGDVVEGVRLDLLPLLEQTQAHLEVDVQACPALSFSEKNLRSVVYNLLSNALKYRSPDRPVQVHVRCRTEEEYIVLEVQDNGLGLDLNRQRQLFAMFQRYHTHVEGSGIGLYMVKKMVENAGGKIEVESQVGVGSTFSVFFRNEG